MNIYIYIVCSLGIILSQTTLAQVGINTNNPLGVFHIASVPHIATDLIVTDANGNMGIGTSSPDTKVHISTTQATPAFRLDDGQQALGRALLTDDNGKASWGNLKNSVGRKYVTTNDAYISGYQPNVPGSNQINSNGTFLTFSDPDGGIDLEFIEVESPGNYNLTIQWYSSININHPYNDRYVGCKTAIENTIIARNLLSVYLMVYKTANNVRPVADPSSRKPTRSDGVEYYQKIVNTGNVISFTTTLIANNCLPGERLWVEVLPIVSIQRHEASAQPERKVTVAVNSM